MLPTPNTPGDYPIPVPAGQPPMLRHWNGKVWSAPWYADDPAEHVQRARAIPMRPEPAWLTRALSDAAR
jgi:hypothetical protein